MSQDNNKETEEFIETFGRHYNTTKVFHGLWNKTTIFNEESFRNWNM